MTFRLSISLALIAGAIVDHATGGGVSVHDDSMAVGDAADRRAGGGGVSVM